MKKQKISIGTIIVYIAFFVLGASVMAQILRHLMLYNRVTINDINDLATSITTIAVILLFISGFILRSRQNKDKK